MNWTFEQIDGPYGGVTEGPAWDGDGLLFTHIDAAQILRFDPATGLSSVYREGTNRANGLMLDSEGSLYACEGGARRVVKYESDSSVTILSDHFLGDSFNIPNDLAIDLRGSIWFTDPYYEGSGGDWSLTRDKMELTHESVYRIDPQDNAPNKVERVTFDTTRPNGILFSLDHRTLYVAQSGRELSELRQLRAYPVNGDGSLGEMSVLHDFGANRGIDGMCLDTEGNIVATAGWRQGGPGPSIYVFAPSGDIVERHDVPVDRPTNCTFGDEDLSTLYVTTIEGYLFRVRTDRQGRLHYP